MLYCPLVVFFDSVVISLSKRKKHELPVDLDCIWWRHNGIAYYREDEKVPCPAVGGVPVRNYSEVLECMAGANCAITGTPTVELITLGLTHTHAALVGTTYRG